MRQAYLITAAVLLLTAVSAAQENRNPDVELPTFVITGSQDFMFPPEEKAKPEFVSTLSDEFLKPRYEADQLNIKSFSDPLRNDATLADTIRYVKGIFEASAGNLYLPSANLTLSRPFHNGLFHARINGYNQRAWVDNADRYAVLADARFSFFQPHTAEFLPGAEFSIAADAGYKAHKFYMTADPELEHQLTTGALRLGMNNQLLRSLRYGLTFDTEFAQLSALDFVNDLNIAAKGYVHSELSGAVLKLDAGLLLHRGESWSYTDKMTQFYHGTALVGYRYGETLLLEGGGTFAVTDNNDEFFRPIGRFVLQFARGISLMGEYAPRIELITQTDMLGRNEYFYDAGFDYLFSSQQHAFKAALKYEYLRFFEISGGASLALSDDTPYFYSTGIAPTAVNRGGGGFSVNTIETTSLGAFLHLLFHPGPHGVLYASFEVDLTTMDENTAPGVDTDGNYLPYRPLYTGSLYYGFAVNEFITLKPQLFIRGAAYADVQNTIELDPVIDVSLEASYRSSETMEFTLGAGNLLDSDNALWQGYASPGVNVQLGVRFTW